MAAKTESPPVASDQRRAMIGAPADLDTHEADKARRQQERDAKRPTHLDCLDPTVAKEHEDRKPLYEWRVTCKIFRGAKGRVAAHLEDFDKKVVAQNQDDAWSMFCDAIQEWPSRRDTKPTIARLQKRTLRSDAHDN